jgi:DNA-binding NarL/FixJ family response regulator
MNAVIEKTFRAIVVDDHPLIRNGISNILNKIPGISCSHQAENGLVALEKNREDPYDIIFLDIGMPVMDGLTTMHHLNCEFPDSNVIILTMYENTRQFIEFIELGVKGYLLKETDETEITRAITMIMEGSQYFTPTVYTAWTRYIREKNADTPEMKQYLFSLRELEVLSLICQQLSAAEIGDMLCLSESYQRGDFQALRGRFET